MVAIGEGAQHSTLQCDTEISAFCVPFRGQTGDDDDAGPSYRGRDHRKRENELQGVIDQQVERLSCSALSAGTLSLIFFVFANVPAGPRPRRVARAHG